MVFATADKRMIGWSEIAHRAVEEANMITAKVTAGVSQIPEIKGIGDK